MTPADAAGGAATAAARPPARRFAGESPDLLGYGEEDETSWLLPYVDVISLLLAFLILALAMSKVSLHRFELLSSSLSQESAPPSLEALKEKIDQMLKEHGLQGQVKTVLDDEGLRMEFRNALLFDSGQADVTPAGRTVIERVVAFLPGIDQRYQIAIEGHTDDVPIHTARFDSNWDLSSARAINVLKFFTNAGIEPKRLSAQGYADTRPAQQLHGDQSEIMHARSENRRVVIRVN